MDAGSFDGFVMRSVYLLWVDDFGSLRLPEIPVVRLFAFRYDTHCVIGYATSLQLISKDCNFDENLLQLSDSKVTGHKVKTTGCEETITLASRLDGFD